MSHHIVGQGRAQTTLFPEALDDFVAEDNSVRVIDVFVEQLDLVSLGFKTAIAKRTGRPGYHPATMLKLYIYGYLNRVQSSRRLETESKRNIELLWLLERLSPDFKTIADFRKNNKLGIKNVCSQFVQLCRQLGMFAHTDIVIDGSKFKACNNKSRNFTAKKVESHIVRLERNIEEYLLKLDSFDDNEENHVAIHATEERISAFKQRLKELKDMGEKVAKHPEKQVSMTDPDSRLMKRTGSYCMVSYNIQAAVDTKHHMIVSHDVTNTLDLGQLSVMGKKAQQAIGRNKVKVYADKGYYSSNDIKELKDTGATPLVPKGDKSGSAKKGIFNRSQFRYNRDLDVYTCPAGNELQYRCNTTDNKGKRELRMYFNNTACRDCTIRHKCTQSPKEPRKIRRWVHENILDDMQKRLDSTPEVSVIRKQTVEHPFGTIKMWMGHNHLLTKRFPNVRTEINLNVLAYNITRMINIMGVKSLISAIKLV